MVLTRKSDRPLRLGSDLGDRCDRQRGSRLARAAFATDGLVLKAIGVDTFAPTDIRRVRAPDRDSRLTRSTADASGVNASSVDDGIQCRANPFKRQHKIDCAGLHSCGRHAPCSAVAGSWAITNPPCAFTVCTPSGIRPSTRKNDRDEMLRECCRRGLEQRISR